MKYDWEKTEVELKEEFLAECKKYPGLFDSENNPAPCEELQALIHDLAFTSIAGGTATLEGTQAWKLLEQAVQIGFEAGRNPHVYYRARERATTLHARLMEKRLSNDHNRIHKADKIIKAAIELRNSGYDGPFIGEVCEPLFKAISLYEHAIRREKLTEE